MSTEENKNNVRAWFAALNSENWDDEIANVYADPDSLERFREEHALFRASFANYHFEIAQIVAEGDNVAFCGTASADFVKEYPFGGLKGVPATGKRLTWDECSFFSVADGSEGWFLADGLSRLQQLGVLSAE